MGVKTSLAICSHYVLVQTQVPLNFFLLYEPPDAWYLLKAPISEHLTVSGQLMGWVKKLAFPVTANDPRGLLGQSRVIIW